MVAATAEGPGGDGVDKSIGVGTTTAAVVGVCVGEEPVSGQYGSPTGAVTAAVGVAVAVGVVLFAAPPVVSMTIGFFVLSIVFCMAIVLLRRFASRNAPVLHSKKINFFSFQFLQFF